MEINISIVDTITSINYLDGCAANVALDSLFATNGN